MTLARLVFIEVILCWVALLGGCFVSLILVRRRRKETAADRQQSVRAPAAIWGLALEAVGIGVAFGFGRPLSEAPAGSVIAAMTLAPACLVLVGVAARHLGAQLRIKAVVGPGHALVTSGPYAMVRHPIYLSLLGMTLATGLINATWPATLGALAIGLLGTEIRIRAEDSLLERCFGAEFEAYRRQVPAYLPWIR